ncbi:MAG: carbon-nitrogen family hydrolase, partial [Deltaproteobacteria bacterium]|nr:carbon-nitrogen family hydrolase [Deltaproteobacteria bacterium]
VHLFPVTGEHKHFVPGDRPAVCQTPWGILGVITCFDLRFPELARAEAKKGAVILAVCAQWPAARKAHWDLLLRARAVENQCFVIGANRCGIEGKTTFPGRSAVISPMGRVLARAGSRGTRLFATLDMKELTAFRKSMPCLELGVSEAYR